MRKEEDTNALKIKEIKEEIKELRRERKKRYKKAGDKAKKWLSEFREWKRKYGILLMILGIIFIWWGGFIGRFD